MKKALLFTLIMIFTLPAFASSFSDLFQDSKKVNKGYIQSSMNFDLAGMDFDKAMIESINQKTDLSSKITYNNAQQTYRKGMTAYYQEIINNFFSVKTTSLLLDSGNLQLQLNKIDLQSAQSSFNKKIISEDSLKDAQMTYDEQELQVKKLKNDYNNAVADYKRSTGTDFADFEPIFPDYKKLKTTTETYKTNDLSLENLRLNMESTRYDLNNMEYGISEYEKKITETKFKIAEMNYNFRLQDNPVEYKNTLVSLENLYNSLNNTKSRLSIKLSSLKDLESRYKKGLVSEKEYTNSRIQYLNTQKNYYDTLKNYINTLISFMMSNGLNVEEAAM